MKKKNGFISISIVYTFFVVFLLLLVLVISNYINNRLTLNIYKLDIKEHLSTIKTSSDDDNINNKCNKYDENMQEDDNGNCRYVGANPNNYACFDNGSGGCINYDKDDAANKPAGLFRIIGVFNEDTHGIKDAKLFKLISADALGNTKIRWDYKSKVGSSTKVNGSNDWSDAQVMYMLNGFVNKGYNGTTLLHPEYTYTSGKYISDGTCNIYVLYNGNSYLTGNGAKTLYVPAWVRSDSSYYENSKNELTTQTLTNTQASMIEDVTWHLGGYSYSLSIGYTTSQNGYNEERGTSVYSGRPTKWIGKIGLIFPSDYGYATSGGTTYTRKACLTSYKMSDWDSYSDCYTNDWLLYSGARTGSELTPSSQYTISSSRAYNNDVINISKNGYVGSSYAFSNFDIRPSFYLKSNISIIGGTGTSTDPYRVGEKSTGAEEIISLASTDTTNLVKDDYDNVRYIGSNPDNYACLSSDGSTCINYNKDDAANKTGGLFRIIGVFNEDTHGISGKQLVKLITADILGNKTIPWDFKQNGVGSSTNNSGSNDWSDSQLMYMLNGFVNTGYKGTTMLHTGYTYNKSTFYINDGTYNIYQLNKGLSYLTGNGIVASLYIPASTTTSGWSSTTTRDIETLTTKQVDMIASVTWHLGGTNSYGTSSNGLAKHWYSYERGTNVISGRPTTWIGKIGLMYPSDYAYATSGGSKCLNNYFLNQAKSDTNSWFNNSTCSENSWLFYSESRTDKNGNKRNFWTMNSYTSVNYYVFAIDTFGCIGNQAAQNFYGARPTFYLKPDVYITGGTGTSTDPYIFVMD